MKLMVCLLIIGALGLNDDGGAERSNLSRARAWPIGAVINDLNIVRRIESEGARMIDAGQTTPCAELAKQSKQATGCLTDLVPSAGQKLTPVELVERQSPGVLVIAGLYKCPKCSRWHANCAGGYLISTNGVAVTCYHVIHVTNSVALVAMDRGGGIYPVREVLAASALNDLALIQLEGSGFTALPVSTNAPTGANVYPISHPNNHFYALSAGLVSRYVSVNTPKGKASIMDITADFAKGSSGCPVFNELGEVVGTITSTESVYYDEKDGHNENLQMVFKHCIPSSALLELLPH